MPGGTQQLPHEVEILTLCFLPGLGFGLEPHTGAGAGGSVLGCAGCGERLG